MKGEPTADNKRLAPPRPAAAPEKPGVSVAEQSKASVVSKMLELVRLGCAGFASLETLGATLYHGREPAAVREAVLTGEIEPTTV